MNYTGITGYGVRVFNSASINEPVNIYFDDREIIRRLAYKAVSDYIPLSKNRYNIKIYGANTGNLLYNQTVDIDSNKFITLTVISENGRLDLVVLEDFSANQRFAPPTERRFTKKIVDSFNNFVEVVVNEAGEIIDDVKDAMGQIIVSAGDKVKKIIDRFGNVVEVVVNSVGEIVALVLDELSGAFKQIVIRIGDSIDKIVDEFGNVVDVVVDEFGSVVGWVIDEPMQSSQSTLMPPHVQNRFQSPNPAFIRVIHLAQNAPAIDTTLPDDTILFVDTKYKQVTDYKRIGINNNTFQLRVTGTNNIILTVPNLNFRPNNYYTLYVIGRIDGMPRLDAVFLQDGR